MPRYEQLAAATFPLACVESGALERGAPLPPARVSLSSVRSVRQAQVVVASLSAIESCFLQASAPGVPAYDEDQAASHSIAFEAVAGAVTRVSPGDALMLCAML